MVTPTQREVLAAMGIDVWERRPAATGTGPVEQPTMSPPPADESRPAARSGGQAWEVLERRVAACVACDLHRSRKQTVFGVGSREAEWLVIGEAPGAEEDRRGEPFVGRAGKLLDSMLGAIGLARERVFIANILKCRPPSNRDPRPEEVVACASFLEQQIALLEPRIILAVGRIAAQNLLGTDTPIGKLRGRVHQRESGGPPVVVTYHPAYLLRSPVEKRKAWEDLKLAMKVYADAVGGAA